MSTGGFGRTSTCKADPMRGGDEGTTEASRRILFTIPNFTTAGSGRAMVNVIDRLDRRRFEPTVVVNHQGGDLVHHLERTGVEVIEAPVTVPLRPLPTLPRRVQRAAAPFRGRFDLWHSFQWQGEVTEALVARASGVRSYLFTKKNAGTGAGRGASAGPPCPPDRGAERTRWRAASSGSRWLRGRVRYVPTGIDVETWARATRDPGLRSRLGVDDDAIVVACVGNVMPGKNQGVLVEATATVDDIHLVLAGPVLDDDFTPPTWWHTPSDSVPITGSI